MNNQKNGGALRSAALFVFALIAATGMHAADPSPGPFQWPAPSNTMRPWSRWWWLGSGVDRPNLERLLGLYHDAGLGGVEICPIYGAKGYEERFIPYLTPKWMDMLGVATGTAAHLGMGVDMTTGTGWPMGGPWIPDRQASESASIQRVSLAADGKLPESPTPSADGHSGMDGMLPASIARGKVLAVAAVSPDGSQTDLIGRMKMGRLDWTAPGPGWKLYILSVRQPVQRVKRAAPGDAGNVVDPYSIASLDTFLRRFDQAFEGYRGSPPRAQFHDSFEYFGANWTPDFMAEFSRRRGYDLGRHLPALAGDGDADTAARVREDYRRTIGELHQAWIARWTEWSHAHGSLTREQAHGAPANIEDVYATADIPETEGSFGGGTDDQIPMMKLASSAAHVSGRLLASSETFTWLGEHFQVPLAQMKPAVDRFFLAGINHIFFHGIPYSPEDAPWPGWLFYASTNLGPNGGIWHDLPAFNAYATRCQSILQAGRPDNDVLLYFPVADFWQSPSTEKRGQKGGDPLIEQFTTPGKWMLGTPFFEAAKTLGRLGFSYDEVTDDFLQKAQADGSSIKLGGNSYRAVVVADVRYLPVETLHRLLELARAGATVVFQGSLPADVPGFANLRGRRADLKSSLGEIQFAPASSDGVRAAHVGVGLILAGADLSSLLVRSGTPREGMVDDGLDYIRRLRTDGIDYFLVNRGSRAVDKWIRLARPFLSAVLFDPQYPDRAGAAAIRPSSESSEVYLQLMPGETRILRTYTDTHDASLEAKPWIYHRAAEGPPLTLTGRWTIHFTEGGPALPKDYESAELGSWTGRDDAEARRFSGTAVYRLDFELPPAAAADWKLDLGKVAESARVRLNGRAVTTLWCAPFSAEVGRFLQPGHNLLEVEVTNLAANRIRDLDKRGVKWKNFYEINFVNAAYQPFDASNWPIRDSGLLGPVTLIPMETAKP